MIEKVKQLLGKPKSVEKPREVQELEARLERVEQKREALVRQQLDVIRREGAS